MNKPELVSTWRTWWRQWSTWLVGAGLTAIQLAPELAEALNYVWNTTPMDIKSAFTPEQIRYIGLAIAAVSIPAKLIRQRGLDKFRGDAKGDGPVSQ